MSEKIIQREATAEQRAQLGRAQRIVLKIGSRSLLADDDRFALMARVIHGLKSRGREVLLVSSGAVAAGRKRLGITERPKRLALLQAVAAAGQSALMWSYEQAFTPYGMRAAQILLTHADLADRDRYLNARNALSALLDLGVVPIINENDTVSVHELKFGDNDQLAALVAALVDADLLVLLTDVEGVLDSDDRRISFVNDPDKLAALIRPPTDDVGLGGMGSKVDAAKRALAHGIPVIIGDARRDDLLERILDGEDEGTLFWPPDEGLATKKHWIAYTLKPKGTIYVDEGAARALIEDGASLLPGGILGVRGNFQEGEAIAIVDPSQREIARGLARFGAPEVARVAGTRAREGVPQAARVVVHRDDLVLLPG